MKNHLIVFALITLLSAGLVQANSSDTSSSAFLKALAEYDHGNYQRAYKKFKQLANRGNRAAQRKVGIMLSKGLGTKKDLVESTAWLTLAAIAGDTESQEIRDDLYSEMDDSSIALSIERTDQLLVGTQIRLLRQRRISSNRIRKSYSSKIRESYSSTRRLNTNRFNNASNIRHIRHKFPTRRSASFPIKY